MVGESAAPDRPQVVARFAAILFAVLLGVSALAVSAPVRAEAAEDEGGVSALGVGASWKRLAGGTALGTMRAVVGEGFADGSCDAVVVATMDGYWDALTASGIAGAKGAPVLLTDGASLSAEARAEIARLGASTAYVAGGPAAVSDVVLSQIRDAGCESVARLAGADAVGTANEIYRGGVGSWGDTCIVATSSTFQDALSIAPFAYARRAPIFLADGEGLSSETLALIKGAGFERAVIAGGAAAVPAAVEGQLASCGIPRGSILRLWGATCYETSAAIAEWEISQGMSAEGMAVATGEGYWDALAGAVLCGKGGSALVLADDANRSCVDAVYRPRAKSVSRAYVLGGEAAVSAATWDYCRATWHDDRYDTVEVSPAVYERQWVPKTVTVPDYEVRYGYVCHDCGLLTESWEEIDDHCFNYHPGGYATTEWTEQVGSHQEDHGSYQSVLVKPAVTKRVLVREAGWY